MNVNYYLAYEYDNDRYNLTIGGQTLTVSSNIAAGTTYGLVARWDTVNTISGSNYVCFAINDSDTCGVTTQPTVSAPDATIYIGSDGTTGGGSGIIEYLSIYRRVLYDGSTGINASSSTDEVAKVKFSGGADPALTTGSWDVLFAIPTNSSTGALSTGTGNAWSHPHSSSLLYTSTTNTGGFMLNGTYTTDGWTDEGTPTTVAALSASQKIFAGGYKTTSDAANEGIYYDKTVSAGNDWVVRALANSDGTCTPKIILYNQTNGAEIGSLTGTTTSTRAAPDVFIFTGEAPSGMTTLRLKLVNTAASGTCSWHQVEVLANLITNPSFETGSGDPWLPTGFSFRDTPSIAGESSQITGETGFGLRVAGRAFIGIDKSLTVPFTGYYSDGFSYGNVVTSRCGIYVIGQDGSTTAEASGFSDGAPWKHRTRVMKRPYSEQPLRYGFETWANNGTFDLDNFYVFQVTDVTLTITPATSTNSTENTDEIRVDGRDTYISSSSEATSITTTRGNVYFNWRPRHAAADAVKFVETASGDAYIVSFAGDSNDYINVYWDSANTIAMAYSMAGTTGSGTWTATGAIAANTEYAGVILYTGGGNMTLSIGGTTRITLSSIPSAFGTAPNTVYWGSDTSGTNQGDATYSSLVFDTTAPSNSLTALSPDPNTDTTPTLSGTATEASGTVSTVQFQMDSTAGSWSSCTADDGSFDEASETFTCTASSLSDGSHTMYVRATDSNNNTTSSGSESSDTFTIDVTAPSVSLTAISPDPGTDNTPTISGTAIDSGGTVSTVQFQVDSTTGTWSSCTASDGSFNSATETFAVLLLPYQTEVIPSMSGQRMMPPTLPAMRRMPLQ